MRISQFVIAGVAGALLAGSAAHGVPVTPQIVDPAGDVKAGGGDADLVSVLFGATKKAGVRDQLTIAITTAAAPAINPGSSYNIRGDLSGCLEWYGSDYWSAEAAGPRPLFTFYACGMSEAGPNDPVRVTVTPTVTIAGNTITFSIPFKSFPAPIVKRDLTFTHLVAWTALAEPVYGRSARDLLYNRYDHPELGAQDWAEGTGSFTTSYPW
ncbi:MAG: hypothetical protein ABR520_03660 [Mycobacteriales bacterium]|nr:hypothetical protein [Frankia sp.]